MSKQTSDALTINAVGKSVTNTNDIESAFKQARRQFDAEWLLVVDAYPSLDATSDKPMPSSETAFIVVDPDGTAFRTTTDIGGHPDILQARIAKAAMQWFRKVIGRVTGA